MGFSISEKVVDKLIDGNIIESEDKELYTYGFHQGFLIIFNILTAIAIGLLFKMVLESVIFFNGIYPPKILCWGISCKNTLKMLYVFHNYYDSSIFRNKVYILE